MQSDQSNLLTPVASPIVELGLGWNICYHIKCGSRSGYQRAL